MTMLELSLARRTEPSQTVVHCVCGLSYCALCGLNDHSPASCRDLLTFNSFNDTISHQERLATSVEVRQCPGCRQVWEKSWGCNHMVCSCGTSFCWGCGRLTSLHRGGGVCGSTRIPLQTRRLEYLPTEVIEIKRIELFRLFSKFDGKEKDFLPLTFRSDEDETVIKVRKYVKTILYGLLREEMAGSNLTKVKLGVSSLIGLSELLHQPERRGQWRERIRRHVLNVEALYQLTLNLNSVS